jgi:hypothetical protein
MLKQINHEGKLIALILTHDHKKDGLEFLTSNDISLQMGYMKYPAGHHIVPHVHKKAVRQVEYTLEAILVKSGKVLVDLYTQEKIFIQSEPAQAGDVILLVSGGHGFRFIEEGELVEIKQGPYVSQEKDKEKFTHRPEK